jgi:glycosyltransferase involved in cell wall biosynthesis
MKVLMIVPQPFFQSRGTPFSVYYRTRTMAALGHQIDIVTYPIGRDVVIPGVRILRSMKVPFISNIKIGPSLPKLILDIPLFFKGFWQLLTTRYDFVHAHEEGVFMCLVYKLFFWRMKILYDMHSSLPQQLKNFKFSSNGLLIGFFEWLENKSLKSSAGVITICPALQETVNGLKIDVPSVMIENVLFDGVNFADKSDDVPAKPFDWKTVEGKKVVLYSGTFEAYQGLPMLMDSIPAVRTACPDAFFLMVGGNPQQVDDLSAQASKLGVAGSVYFTGNVPANAVKEFIRRCDVLVSPRMKGTNTPLKLYEYLAAGKPMVATRHATHTQVLSDKEAILAEVNPASFAAGIVEALTNSKRAAEVVEGALALYRREYAPEIYFSRLDGLIRRVAEGKPVAPSGTPVGAL